MVAIEASRLARNGRDWHTLLEFCGLVGTLIVDEDGVYELTHWRPCDRFQVQPIRRTRSRSPIPDIRFLGVALLWYPPLLR